jgi:hypothetical protein
MHRIDAIPKFIIACCVLHNICLRFEDPFLRIYSRKGQYFLRSVEGVNGQLPLGLQVNVEVPNGNPPNGEPINEKLNAMMPPEEEENHDNSAKRERENIAMLLYLNFFFIHLRIYYISVCHNQTILSLLARKHEKSQRIY